MWSGRSSTTGSWCTRTSCSSRRCADARCGTAPRALLLLLRCCCCVDACCLPAARCPPLPLLPRPPPAAAHKREPSSPPPPQVFLTPQHLCIAMEYAAGGDMFEVGARSGGGVAHTCGQGGCCAVRPHGCRVCCSSDSGLQAARVHAAAAPTLPRRPAALTCLAVRGAQGRPARVRGALVLPAAHSGGGLRAPYGAGGRGAAAVGQRLLLLCQRCCCGGGCRCLHCCHGCSCG